MGRKRAAISLDSSDESPPPAKRVAKGKNHQRSTTISSLFLTASKRLGSQEEPSSQPTASSLSLHSLLQRSPSVPVPKPASTLNILEKYQPAREEDLIVHRKKLGEVRQWLEAKLQRCCTEHAALVISGPPGSGKSCSIRVLAAELGCDVIEWNAPVPNVWAEHLYSRSFENEYSSKLAEFEMFALRAKFPSLSLTKSEKALNSLSFNNMSQSEKHSSKPRLLLIDDLPYISDGAQRKRLVTILQNLATTARCPVVIISTEASSGASSNSREVGGSSAAGWQKGLHKEVIAGLEEVQATFMSFNPITSPNIVKLLTKICTTERLGVSQEAIKVIAEQSSGDLRNALQSLQLVTSGVEPKAPAAAAKGGKGKRQAKKPNALYTSSDKGAKTTPTYLEKDLGLGLFHALGKLLYNKREADGTCTKNSTELDPSHIQKKFCSMESWMARGVHRRQHADACESHQIPQVSTKMNNDDVIDLAASDSDTPDCAARPQATIQSDVQKSIMTGTHANQGQQDMPPSTSGAGNNGRSRLGPWRGEHISCDDVTTERHFNRLPFNQNPDQILQRSGLEASAASLFLHENYLNFLADGGVEDAAGCSAYLSDAGFMSCYRSITAGSSSYWGEDDGGGVSLLDAAAGSVASRGLLWGNANMAKNRWLPLRASQSLKVDHARTENRSAIQQGLVGGSQRGNLSAVLSPAGALDQFACEVLPVLRCLSTWDCRAFTRMYLPASWLLPQRAGLVRQANNLPLLMPDAQGSEDVQCEEDTGERIEDSDDERGA